eukprot:CAMPEP_0197731374 /NCGR_PEP_ID=MMETSP1434-20131217/37255_1 /TAXON_ID=265543 /ORGANISM="Minutocellus polymorphus, Strain CCMP3303" /LENGTH=57 /DNA_ID=CAMNT_0043318345 /DNA_START=69 /DNA_END=239 /DNA_ORIENTATION=+
MDYSNESGIAVVGRYNGGGIGIVGSACGRYDEMMAGSLQQAGAACCWNVSGASLVKA